MLSQETLQKILGINEKVYLTSETMAKELRVTFFPNSSNSISENIINFSENLKNVFKKYNCTIIPYDLATEQISLVKVFKRVLKLGFQNINYVFKKIINRHDDEFFIPWKAFANSFKRTRIKKGVSVIVLGEQPDGLMPMELIYNFKASSIISILDFPKNISSKSSFVEHFDTAMSLFAYHMTNIVIAVDSEKWMLYNFNASHPIYSNSVDFDLNVLNALIPKIVAPISPLKLNEFKILKDKFNVSDGQHENIINDIVSGAKSFEKTNLFPPGKKIDDLPFRNNFYKLIGKMHLDNRSGMSFGFLAHQMPSKLVCVRTCEDVEKKLGIIINSKKDSFTHNDDLYITIKVENKKLCLKVPEIWVLTQRSGSNKNNINKNKDLIKLGLKNGIMYLQTPQDLILHADYKTSFDTMVILSHCVGNSIIASIQKYLYPNSIFSNQIEKNGMAMAHWHGYFHPDQTPEGWTIHGIKNPHVACSSPQSAIYAIDGKIKSFLKLENKKSYKGDIHIEPHHGTNICFSTLPNLSKLLISNPGMSTLGNKYLYLYKS